MRVIVSLHDVCPHHLTRLVRAEELFVSADVARVTYLLVPHFHGGRRAEDSPDFMCWTRAARPFEVRWFLHGHYHSEVASAGPTQRASPGDWFARTLLTAGEGEFLKLTGAPLRDRLERGTRCFQACFGVRPYGFVAPAWLHSAELMPVLRDRGFMFSEDRARIFQLQTGRAIAAPVMTWATRTALRKYGSLIVAPALARLTTSLPVVRVALHPADFDHPRTVANIRRVLDHTRRTRQTAFYDHELFSLDGPE